MDRDSGGKDQEKQAPWGEAVQILHIYHIGLADGNKPNLLDGNSSVSLRLEHRSLCWIVLKALEKSKQHPDRAACLKSTHTSEA